MKQSILGLSLDDTSLLPLSPTFPTAMAPRAAIMQANDEHKLHGAQNGHKQCYCHLGPM